MRGKFFREYVVVHEPGACEVGYFNNVITSCRSKPQVHDDGRCARPLGV